FRELVIEIGTFPAATTTTVTVSRSGDNITLAIPSIGASHTFSLSDHAAAVGLNDTNGTIFVAGKLAGPTVSRMKVTSESHTPVAEFTELFTARGQNFSIHETRYDYTLLGLERINSSGIIDSPAQKTLFCDYSGEENWTYEVEVTPDPNTDDVMFIGFGQGLAGGFNNEPTNSFVFRIHSGHSTGNFRIDAAVSIPDVNHTFGHFKELALDIAQTPSGKTKFLIERAGDEIRLSIPGITLAPTVFSYSAHATELGLDVAGQSCLFLANQGVGTVFNSAVVTIITPNTAPVIDPIADQTLEVGGSLSLLITASDADVDDVITLTASGLPTGATFDGLSGLLSYPAAVEGVDTVTITADDGNGGTDTETFTITVADTTPPTITEGPDAIDITETSATITFTTNELSTTEVTYFKTPDGLAGSLTVLDPTLVTQHSVTLTELAAGTEYTYSVKAGDAAGNLKESLTRIFTTLAVNVAPVASASADQITVTASVTVNFTGSGTDIDGTIASFSWDFGDGSPATAASTSSSATHAYSSEGTFIATLTVTDDDGATGTDTVTTKVVQFTTTETTTATFTAIDGIVADETYTASIIIEDTVSGFVIGSSNTTATADALGNLTVTGSTLLDSGLIGTDVLVTIEVFDASETLVVLNVTTTAVDNPPGTTRALGTLDKIVEMYDAAAGSTYLAGADVTGNSVVEVFNDDGSRQTFAFIDSLDAPYSIPVGKFFIGISKDTAGLAVGPAGESPVAKIHLITTSGELISGIRHEGLNTIQVETVSTGLSVQAAVYREDSNSWVVAQIQLDGNVDLFSYDITSGLSTLITINFAEVKDLAYSDFTGGLFAAARNSSDTEAVVYYIDGLFGTVLKLINKDTLTPIAADSIGDVGFSRAAIAKSDGLSTTISTIDLLPEEVLVSSAITVTPFGDLAFALPVPGTSLEPVPVTQASVDEAQIMIDKMEIIRNNVDKLLNDAKSVADLEKEECIRTSTFGVNLLFEVAKTNFSILKGFLAVGNDADFRSAYEVIKSFKHDVEIFSSTTDHCVGKLAVSSIETEAAYEEDKAADSPEEAEVDPPTEVNQTPPGLVQFTESGNSVQKTDTGKVTESKSSTLDGNASDHNIIVDPVAIPARGSVGITFDTQGKVTTQVEVFKTADLLKATVLTSPKEGPDTSHRLTVVGLTPGTDYTYRIKTFAETASVSDRERVSVEFQFTTLPNQSPSIDSPIIDQTITIGDPFSLNLAGVFIDPDPIDTTLFLSVTAVPDLPSSLIFDSSTLLISGTPVPGDEEVYIVTVTAKDIFGGSSVPDQFTLTVEAPNQAPTAIARADKTIVQSGGLVTFDGTDSSDPNPGDTLTFSWNFGDVSAPETGDTTTHIYTADGTFTATLRVTDGGGLSSTDTVIITVTSNKPPEIITPTAEKIVVQAGTAVNFIGTATDPDGEIALYIWDFDDDGTADYLNSTTGITEHIYSDLEIPTATTATSKTYTARFTVSDSLEVTAGTIATTTITVVVTDGPAAAVSFEETFTGSPAQEVTVESTVADSTSGTNLGSTTTTVTTDANGTVTVSGQVNVSPDQIGRDVTIKTIITDPTTGEVLASFTDATGIIDTIAGTGVEGFSGDGGVATGARFDKASGLAVDSVGNIYIADAFNHRIRKITKATGLISTIAGTGVPGSSGDDGVATTGQLDTPVDVAVDSVGNIYIADRGNNKVRKLTTSDGGTTYTISTFAGIGGLGGFSGDDGQANLAQLSFPSGVGLDSAGNVYIADTVNRRIRKVAPSGIITTIAGAGLSGSDSDLISATGALIDLPEDVAVDASGQVYISEFGKHRVRRVDTLGIITTVAGDGFVGTDGIDSPKHLDVDSAGNVYFASAAMVIHKIDASTGAISVVAGTLNSFGFGGDGGQATAAQLFLPQGVAVDSNLNIYIADTQNHRIRKVSAGPVVVAPDTTPPTISGITGTALATYHNTSFTQVDVGTEILDLAARGLGELSIIWSDDKSRILSCSATLLFDATSTTLTTNRTADMSIPVIACGLDVELSGLDLASLPSDQVGFYELTLSATDEVGNNIEEKFTWEVRLSAITGTQGFIDGQEVTQGSSVNGTLILDSSASDFTYESSNPLLVTINSSGGFTILETVKTGTHVVTLTATNKTTGFISSTVLTIEVLDGGGTLRTLDQDTDVASIFDISGLPNDSDASPTPESEDGSLSKAVTGSLFYTSAKTNEIFGRPNTYTGTFTLLPITGATLNTPAGFSLDTANNKMYLANAGANQVLEIDLLTHVATVLADAADGLSLPVDAELTSAGTVVIASAVGSKIHELDLATGNVTLLADSIKGVRFPVALETGPANSILILNGRNFKLLKLNRDTLKVTVLADASDGLKFPKDLSVRPDGRTLIANAGTHQILEYNFHTDTVSVFAGTGVEGSSGDGGQAKQSTFNRPISIALDTNGTLVILDSGNAAIRAIQGAGVPVAGPNLFLKNPNFIDDDLRRQELLVECPEPFGSGSTFTNDCLLLSESFNSPYATSNHSFTIEEYFEQGQSPFTLDSIEFERKNSVRLQCEDVAKLAFLDHPDGSGRPVFDCSITITDPTGYSETTYALRPSQEQTDTTSVELPVDVFTNPAFNNSPVVGEYTISLRTSNINGGTNNFINFFNVTSSDVTGPTLSIDAPFNKDGGIQLQQDLIDTPFISFACSDPSGLEVCTLVITDVNGVVMRDPPPDDFFAYSYDGLGAGSTGKQGDVATTQGFFVYAFAPGTYTITMMAQDALNRAPSDESLGRSELILTYTVVEADAPIASVSSGTFLLNNVAPFPVFDEDSTVLSEDIGILWSDASDLGDCGATLMHGTSATSFPNNRTSLLGHSCSTLLGTSTLTFLPSDLPGFYKLTLFADDEQGTRGTTTHTYEVENVNDAPVLGDIADRSGTSADPIDAALSFALVTSDVDGDALTCSAINLPDGLSMSLSGCTITGTPTTLGTSFVTVTVTDGNGGTDSKSYTHEIFQPNRDPELLATSDQTIEVGSLLNLDFVIIDPDGDLITCAASGLPAGASLDSLAPCTLTYTPTVTDFAVSHSITLTATDVHGLAVSDTFVISVIAPEAEKPVPITKNIVIQAGSSFSVPIRALDPEGRIITCAISGLPAGVTLDANTCTLSGTLHTLGSFEVFVVTTNELGYSRSAVLNINAIPEGNIYEISAEIRIDSQGIPLPAGSYLVSITILDATSTLGSVSSFITLNGTEAATVTANLFAGGIDETGETSYIAVIDVHNSSGELVNNFTDTVTYIDLLNLNGSLRRGLGNPGTAEGGINSVAISDAPGGAAVGSLFISEPSNNRILGVENPGEGTLAPLLITGAALNGPTALTVTGDHSRLIVANTGNNNILEVDLTTFVATVIADATDGLLAPTGVAINSVGDILISSTGSNEIYELDSITGVVALLADATDGLLAPAGIDVSKLGTLMIANKGADQLLELNLATGTIRVLAGVLEGISAPADVAVKSTGNVLIANSGTSQILEFNVFTGTISVIAGTGVAGSGGGGGRATDAQLNTPLAIALDENDGLFVADTGNNAIRKVNGPAPAPEGSDETAPEITLAAPFDVDGYDITRLETDPLLNTIDYSCFDAESTIAFCEMTVTSADGLELFRSADTNVPFGEFVTPTDV
ncbi:MAG: PKD domain-containing protein, partial [Deltaproteobacteria bacterium]|nr:PKD domain-containing protein [Deltaproteobacteria bacterium]